MGNYKTNQIMYWGASKVTDHGRSPLSESFEVVERKTRMANGFLRKYVVANKKNWSCSWENVPSENGVAGGMNTVDGGMAGKAMEAFYLANAGKAFTMTLRDGQGNQTPYTVMISDFSKDIVKRGVVDLYSINVTIEEV